MSLEADIFYIRAVCVSNLILNLHSKLIFFSCIVQLFVFGICCPHRIICAVRTGSQRNYFDYISPPFPTAN